MIKHLFLILFFLPSCIAVRYETDIDKAFKKKNSIGSLTLKDKDVYLIDERITQLKNLKYLTIIGSNINQDDLFTKLAKLKKLRFLDFRTCNIEKLSSKINYLENLSYLSFVDNYNFDVEQVISIIANNEIDQLVFINCGLRMIPENIKKIKNLKGISFSKNPNIDIQTTLKNLSYLEHLNYVGMGECDISTFPSNIFLLKSLRNCFKTYFTLFNIIRSNAM